MPHLSHESEYCVENQNYQGQISKKYNVTVFIIAKNQIKNDIPAILVETVECWVSLTSNQQQPAQHKCPCAGHWVYICFLHPGNNCQPSCIGKANLIWRQPTDLQISVCIEKGYVLGAIPQSDFLCLSSSALPRRRSTTQNRRGRSGRSGGPSDHLLAFTQTPLLSQEKNASHKRQVKSPTVEEKKTASDSTEGKSYTQALMVLTRSISQRDGKQLNPFWELQLLCQLRRALIFKCDLAEVLADGSITLQVNHNTEICMNNLAKECSWRSLLSYVNPTITKQSQKTTIHYIYITIPQEQWSRWCW